MNWPKVKPPKQSKCREKAAGCQVTFIRCNSLQATCFNPLCALKKAQRDRAKREAKEKAQAKKQTKSRRESAKSRGEWLKEAQAVFNRFIRLRDMANGCGCISCGTRSRIQYCGGHFYTRKARPDLRFNEDNVHLQCNFYCNRNLSGNIEQYRPNLIAKIGPERFEALAVVGRSDWTIDEIKEIKKKYAAMALELEKLER